jgi:hypothetical protein
MSGYCDRAKQQFQCRGSSVRLHFGAYSRELRATLRNKREVPVKAHSWLLSAFVTMLFACAGAATPDPPVLVPLGWFSSMNQTAEHCNGYRVALWKYSDSSLRGVFEACAGLVGDLRRAHISVGSFDAQANTVTFEAELSLGMDYIVGGSETPSRDHFVFSGHLKNGSLQGELTHSDLVHPGHKVKTAALLLSRRTIPLESYETLDGWEKAHQESSAGIGVTPR